MAECKYQPGQEWLKALVSALVSSVIVGGLALLGIRWKVSLETGVAQTRVELEPEVEWISDEQLEVALTVRNTGDVQAQEVTVDVDSSRPIVDGVTIEPQRFSNALGSVSVLEDEFSIHGFSMNPDDWLKIVFGVANRRQDDAEETLALIDSGDEARAFIQSEIQSKRYRATCANCPGTQPQPTPKAVGFPSPTPTYTPRPTPAPTPTATATTETAQAPLWRSSEGCGNPNATISSIQPELLGFFANGDRLLVIGTANIDDFDYYTIEFGFGPSPSDNTWRPLWNGVKPVVNEVLYTWDTRDMGAILPGIHSVRLVVVDHTGNYPEPCQITFEIPLETPIPPGATPFAWPTPPPGWWTSFPIGE